MENEYCPIEWTEEQWNQVQETVRNEATKVRVAALVLPTYGPLPCDAESVSMQEVRQESTGEPHLLGQLADELRDQANAGAPLGQVLHALEGRVRAVEHSASRRRGEALERLMVDDTRCRRLTKISVNVYLTSAQLCQPDLSSALIMFRRAANLIARVEDRIVFGGQPGPDPNPQTLGIGPPIFRVTGGEQFRGLIAEALAITTPNSHCVPVPPGPPPENIVTAVATAITDLEGEGHLSPFALVLGSNLFIKAYDPSPSLVMPADRIKPLLGGGPLLRSTTIPPDEGVLISQAGELVDLVMANDISAKYLQTTLEPRHVFRVSQRMTLRVKQPGAIMALQPNC